MPESLMWVVPIAVLAAGLRDPRGGLVVLATCLPLFGSPPGGPYLAALDLAVVAAIATAWRAGKPSLSRIDTAAWVFLAVSAASLVPLAYLPPSWRPDLLLRLFGALPGSEPWSLLYGWRAWANLALGLGLYVAVRRAYTGRSQRSLLLGLAVGLGVTLSVGLASHIGLIELGGFRVKGGPIWATRLHSFFFHSGWLAEYIVLAAPVAVALLLALGRRFLPLVAASVGLVALVIFLTEQRGAWLAVLGQMGLAGLIWGVGRLSARRAGADRAGPLPRRSLLAAAAVVVALGAGGLALEPGLFDAAFKRARGNWSVGRLSVWRVSAQMTAERPLLGWGVGAFSSATRGRFGEFDPARFDWLTAHNQYVMIAMERGLLGLAAFGLLFWALGETLIAAWRGPPGGRLPATGLAIAFAGFAAYGLVQYMFFIQAIALLFWMLVGSASLLAPAIGRRPVDRVALSVAVIAALLVPWRALALTPVEAADNRSFGFRRPEISGERGFQWTGRYAVRRLPRPDGEVLSLELANGHPVPARHRVEVVVRVDGREAVSSEIGGEWRSFSIPLAATGRDSVLVEIEARPAFRPFHDYRRYPELGESTDIRLLGVAVSFAPPQ